MVSNRGALLVSGVAFAALALACVPVSAPVSAMSPKFSVRTAPAAPSFRMADSIGSFTPAAADPRHGLGLGRAGQADSGFRFTPSTSPGKRRGVTVAIRARATTAAQVERLTQISTTPAAITPTAYNLGVALGWRRFAITGDVVRVETGLLPLSREGADVGLSFAGDKWSTRVQLGAERATGASPIIDDESYSVDLGGSYSLTGNIDLTGGIRYKMQHDRIARLADQRLDSQAVYVGTAFRF